MITSELLRICYTRTGRILLSILLLEAVLVGLLLVFLPNVIDALIALNGVIPNATSADRFSEEQLVALTMASPQFQLLIADILANVGLGTSLPAIAATLFGTLTITGEIRRGSITNAALDQPVRWRLVLAKIAALVVAVIASAAVLIAVRASILGVGLAVQGEPFLLDAPALFAMWALSIVTLVLYTMVGLGIGLLIRHQVAAISVTFTAIAVESIVRALALLVFGEANPTLYLPFGLVPDLSQNNPLAVLGADAALTAGLTASAAILALALWAGSLVAAATVRFSRADIPSQS